MASNAQPATPKEHTENDAALSAGVEIGRMRAVLSADAHVIADGARPFRVLGDGRVESLEKWLAHPTERRGYVQVRDAAGFVALVERFKDGGSVVFVDILSRAATCVVDFHNGTGPGRWGKFRIALEAQHSPAWKRWEGNAGTKMSQAAFAQFIEDNVPDVAHPPGAAVVEVARALEAKKDVQFHSVIRATDGSVDFAYREDVSGTTRGGALIIPDGFTLGIPVFTGGDAFMVSARFRYRLDDRRLVLWYELPQAEQIVEAAFADFVATIVAGVGDTLVVNGIAPIEQSPV